GPADLVRAAGPAPAGEPRVCRAARPAYGSAGFEHHRGDPVAEQQPAAPGAERPDLTVGGQRPAGVEEAELVGLDKVPGRHDDPVRLPARDHRARVGHGGPRRAVWPPPRPAARSRRTGSPARTPAGPRSRCPATPRYPARTR